MKRVMVTIVAVLAIVGSGLGAPPPEALVQRLTNVIRKHCPEAKIEVTEHAFVAR